MGKHRIKLKTKTKKQKLKTKKREELKLMNYFLINIVVF